MLARINQHSFPQETQKLIDKFQLAGEDYIGLRIQLAFARKRWQILADRNKVVLPALVECTQDTRAGIRKDTVGDSCLWLLRYKVESLIAPMVAGYHAVDKQNAKKSWNENRKRSIDEMKMEISLYIREMVLSDDPLDEERKIWLFSSLNGTIKRLEKRMSQKR